MNNIAVLLSDQENYVEAEKLYQKVFQGFSKIFGSEHTETKRAKNAVTKQKMLLNEK